MLYRIIFIALAVWLLIHLVRHQRNRRMEGVERRPVKIVRCHHCGVHLPIDEALGAPPRYYCSAEHQRAAGD